MRYIFLLILCGFLISCGGSDNQSTHSHKLNDGTIIVEGYTPQLTDVGQKKIESFFSHSAVQQKILFDSPINSLIIPRNYSGGGNISLPKIGSKRTQTNIQTVFDSSKIKWQINSENKLFASIIIDSPEALGIRVAINFKEINQGSLFIFRNSKNTNSHTHTSEDLLINSFKEKDGSLTYISPFIAGEELIIDIILSSSDQRSLPKINFPYISHFNTAVEPGELIIDSRKSSSCNINSVCDFDSLKTSSSVAKILFTDPETGGSYVCSGTLLNDRLSSGTPFLITASHCIGNQNIANTVQTFWFYRSLKCNELEMDPRFTSVSGGSLFLHSDDTTDISLIKLNKNPPQGATFSGWSSAHIDVNNLVSSLHHPRGDLQKISTGFIRNHLQCFFYPNQDEFGCKSVDVKIDPNSTHYGVRWSSGVTEGGSSGSGLFLKINGSNYLIGNLSGGNESCENLQGFSAFGRFDKSYNSALFRWLDNSSRDFINPFYELAELLKKSLPR